MIWSTSTPLHSLSKDPNENSEIQGHLYELPCARGDTAELQGEEFCIFSKPQKLDVIQQNQRGVPEDKPCSVLTLSSQAELETLLPFSEILPSPTSLWILYIPNLHANRLAKVTLGNFLLYISGCRCMHKRWLQE